MKTSSAVVTNTLRVKNVKVKNVVCCSLTGALRVNFVFAFLLLL